jgi:hypothetical protein
MNLETGGPVGTFSSLTESSWIVTVFFSVFFSVLAVVLAALFVVAAVGLSERPCLAAEFGYGLLKLSFVADI